MQLDQFPAAAFGRLLKGSPLVRIDMGISAIDWVTARNCNTGETRFLENIQWGYFGTLATGWGVTAAGQAGYDRRLSPHWSIGVVAALALYRCWTSDAGVASASDGLLPSLSLAFTFR